MAVLAAATTCQMQSSPAGVPAQRGSMPQQLPLLKPLGARHQQLPRLFSAVANQLDAAAPGFVRPDVPPDSDDEAPPMWSKKPASRSALEAPRSGLGQAKGSGDTKANFRSPLEQASWLSSEGEAGRADKTRSGLLGLGEWNMESPPYDCCSTAVMPQSAELIALR